MARPKAFDPQVVLDRAVDSFWQLGFDGVAVQDLCRAMVINPGSLYGTYGDKRALFLAALDRYMETVSKDAIERIAGESSGRSGIRSYFAFLVDAIIDGKRRWGCLVTNAAVECADHDPEIAERISLHFARLETAFASALARARLAGEIGPGGMEAAPYLVCVVQGMNVLAKTKPTRARLEAIAAAALRSLAN